MAKVHILGGQDRDDGQDKELIIPGYGTKKVTSKEKVQAKEQKRNITIKEIYSSLPQTPITKEGNSWEVNLQELDNPSLLKVRLKRTKGMATTSKITIPGYMEKGEGNSLNKRYGVTLRQWKGKMEALENSGELNGEILQFSIGSHSNHFLFLIPSKGKEILVNSTDGGEIPITRDNYLNYPIIGTRHGRLYKMGTLLAYTYNLKFHQLAEGTYKESNPFNFNWEEIPEGSGNYHLFNSSGSPRELEEIPPTYSYTLEGIKETRKALRAI